MKDNKMTNKIESFNSELTRVQLAVTRILKNSTNLDKKASNITQAKIEYFNSSESLEDLFVVGECYDQKFANRNNGIGKRQFDEIKKSDPDTKRINVKKVDLENEGLNKISQRLSECHQYFAYNKEFETARVEMQVGDKPKDCMSLAGVITHMKSDQMFPYDDTPKLKNSEWVIKQLFKMLDKNEIDLSTFMSAFGKNEDMLRYYAGNKIIKEMGKTKVTPAKNKSDVSLSLENLSTKISA